MDEGDQKLVVPEWGDPRFGQWDGNMWISFEQPCDEDDFDVIDYLEKFKKDTGAGAHDIDIYETLKPPEYAYRSQRNRTWSLSLIVYFLAILPFSSFCDDAACFKP